MEAPPVNEQAGIYYGQPGQYGTPSPYGAAGYDAILPPAGGKQPSALSGLFSGFGGKDALNRGRRRRMNAVPLLLSVLVPWALFAVVYACLSFSFHFNRPSLCWGVVLGALALVALAGVFALSPTGRYYAGAEHEPTWLIFLFVSMLLAWVGAYVLGSENYGPMQKYYNMMDLNNYTDVNPAKVRGEQVMDAGIIQFMEGSKLDLAKSMGFKDNTIYCVAPVSIGGARLATYDFWVVGKDCCTSNKADYRCEYYNNPNANGGLRLMTDADRSFYRLAVQQAEANYGIQANHPLFFVWGIDPSDVVEAWKQTGRSAYLVWMLSYGVFQAFLVAIAALTFAKLGFSS